MLTFLQSRQYADNFFCKCTIGPKLSPVRAASSERPIDSIDRKILAALAEDGRMTLADLSQQVGLSQSPCWTRLRRLEERGIIRGYVALLDHRALGFSNIVFVEITLDSHNEDRVAAFGSALARLPEVLEAHLVTGDYDYLVKIAVSGTDHYEAFLRNRLYKIEGIRNSRSMFGLRALKHVASVDPLLVIE